jgi:predicted small secreted protein
MKKICIILAFWITIIFWFSGCSTMEGLGSLAEGIGKDVRDAAKGTRKQMAERDLK